MPATKNNIMLCNVKKWNEMQLLPHRFSHTKASSTSASGAVRHNSSAPQLRPSAQPQPPPRRPVMQASVSRVALDFQNLAGGSGSSVSSDTSWAEAPEFVPRSFEGEKGPMLWFWSFFPLKKWMPNCKFWLNFHELMQKNNHFWS
jgi:hypothetical protein